MTEQHERECKEYIIACEGEWEETVVCKECGVPVISKEIIRALHATQILSAEDALFAASVVDNECILGNNRAPYYDMLKKVLSELKAYADTLEGKMTEQYECEWFVYKDLDGVVSASCKFDQCNKYMEQPEVESRLNEYETLQAALSVAMSENQRLTKIVEDYEEHDAKDNAD